ncbi:LysE family translocator [Rubinisphaera margarita]|uniref:LysE family translocator n=1 Tax=Rubinisphaera margarita TaxID=2909586 RepID=UPI001EE901B6|nr:LysE family translocator [Rubinisphaera margarita]MCG6156391.1 LysE family translocator [Rubinisphaera margarita]
MPPLELFPSFLLAALACNLAPGPDLLGILSYGMSRGRRAGQGFAFGVGLGVLFHTALAVLGLSALIAASPIAFRIVLYAGASYLIYLGARALCSRTTLEELEQTQCDLPGGFWKSAGHGFLTNALNPKVAIFFLAFLPQFINPGREVSQQLLALGLVFWSMTNVLYITFGYFSGTIGEWLKQRASVGQWVDRIAGALFVGLGLHLLLVGQKP